MPSQRALSRRQRGAGLVEYALLMGLFAIVLFGGADALAGSGSEKLVERGGTASGRGDVIGSLASQTTGTTPTTTPSVTTTTVQGDILEGGVAPLEIATSPENGGKWQATVTIQVSAANGQPLQGATVVGEWIPASDATTCEATTQAGVCILTFARIHKDVPEVTFTLTSVTYTNPSGNPIQSVTFPEPSSITATKP